MKFGLPPHSRASQARRFRVLARKAASRRYFLDGGDSDFTKFLVDGVPMNEPGGAIEIENYSLAECGQDRDRARSVERAFRLRCGGRRRADFFASRHDQHSGAGTNRRRRNIRNGLGQRAIQRSRGPIRLFRVGWLFRDGRPGAERLFSRCSGRGKFWLEILGHGYAAS